MKKPSLENLNKSFLANGFATMRGKGTLNVPELDLHFETKYAYSVRLFIIEYNGKKFHPDCADRLQKILDEYV